MVELIKGLRKPLSGRIAVNNQPYLINHTYQSVNKGMGWIEESPYETMFIHNMTVLDNLCLTLTKKVPQIWMKKRYLNSIRKFVSGFMDDDIAKVKPDGLPPAKLLQIAYIKWLLYAPSVVICIKPFTEVDIHLRRVTQQMIGLLQSRGIAVVIFTSNISETAPVEGETIYIRNGRVTDKDTIYQFIYGEEESSTDGPMVPRP
jgi:ribose transport system ATP-binding protein